MTRSVDTSPSTPTKYRRVVTANSGGKSVVSSDEELLPYAFRTIPGYMHTLVWKNDGTPDLSREQAMNGYPRSVVPGPGGTTLHIVTFPPSSIMASPSFDGAAAQQESLERLPGLADTFEHDGGGMHTTRTVDYSLVFEGEIWLELDDGKTVHLRRGDVVVQNGTRHAWRNKGERPVVMLFFMNGAKGGTKEA
jgi:mannose-6-phosphate isomerase-like protein (cupin superfamily)